MAILVTDHPGVQVGDRVRPRAQRNTAIGQIMILLNRAIQRPDRTGQPAGREMREVVAKEIGTQEGRGGGEGDEDESGTVAHSMLTPVPILSPRACAVSASWPRTPNVAVPGPRLAVIL